MFIKIKLDVIYCLIFSIFMILSTLILIVAIELFAFLFCV